MYTLSSRPIIILISKVFQWGSSYCNIHQWFPRNKLQARALSTLIRNTPGNLTKSFCTCWIHLVAGFGSNQLDKSMLPLIFGHFPAGSSAKQIMHYAQIILSGNRRFWNSNYNVIVSWGVYKIEDLIFCFVFLQTRFGSLIMELRRMSSCTEALNHRSIIWRMWKYQRASFIARMIFSQIQR